MAADVVVAGAGPTGLTLALDLARRGVAVRIVDAADSPFPGSRGKGVTARTREVFDDFGLTAGLNDIGFEHMKHRVHVGGAIVRDDDPNEGRGPSPDRPFGPVGLLAPQWRVEQLLRDRLGEFGVEVEYGTTLAAAAESGDLVEVRFADDTTTETAWLVGCDGARSTIRKLLGLSFLGDGGPQAMLLGDVHVDGLTPDRWYQWQEPDKGFLALCPFRGIDSWQFQGMLWADFGPDGALPEPTLEHFQEIVATVTGRDDIAVADPTWLSRWRVNVRMVDRLRVGRILLAGDAAHVHSPTGGLGMNTGIQDSYNLGWKLARVVAGADAALLDTYGAERLPIAQWTLGVSTAALQRMTDGLTEGEFGGITATNNQDGHQLSLGYPWSSLSVDASGPVTSVAAGRRAPDAPLGDATLFDAFRGTHFTILAFGCVDEARSIADMFHGVRSVEAGQAATEIYGVDDPALVLVRPDGYVGLTASPREVSAVADYLRSLS